MGRGIQWDFDAWSDYCLWQQEDKATLKRINALIKDTLRDPFDGLGKPEPLKHDMSGFWSRRINETDRLVYCLKDNVVVIISCKGHYET